jgi:4'-phosphopantetheinyl transferase
MVKLFTVKTLPEKAFEGYREQLMEGLSEGSRTAVLKFRKPADLQRSLLGEILARTQLSRETSIPASELAIVRTIKGKPYLEGNPNLHYNISHSGDWVVMALSDREVGIDVERIREPHYRIAERFFSAPELEELNRLQGKAKKDFFFDLWTLKESYLKLLGKGLTKSLGSFTLKRDHGEFILVTGDVKDDSVHFTQVPIDPAYKLSVCHRSTPCDPEPLRMTVENLSEQMQHG